MAILAQWPRSCLVPNPQYGLSAVDDSPPQGKHCLLTGTIQALQSLKSIAPPITFLVKAMTEESIT